MERLIQNPARLIDFNSGISIEIIRGDITRIKTGAIINAANKDLRHGGGVAGAISRRGGPIVQDESNAWIAQHGPIDFDRPAYTQGGNLPCKFIIHTAGPVWGEGNEDQKLTNAIRSALQMAEQLQVSSVTIPAISTGIFGFPIKRAAGVFMRTLDDFVNTEDLHFLKKITLVLFDGGTLDLFTEAFDTFKWEDTLR